MLCNWLQSLPRIAAWLVLVSGTAATAQAGALPGGSSPAFHDRMMAWSRPASAQGGQAAIANDLAPPRATSPEPRVRLPYLSSRFGLRTDPFDGTRRMHSGIDIPGPYGSPILAADAGTVTFAGSDGGYGLMVEVDHGNGLRTRYGHLSRILVGVGTTVTRDQRIALMGSTGRSTGSHLHFEVLRNGMKVNPVDYLGQSGPDAPFVPHRMAPVVYDEAPAHISRFARALAAQAEGDGEQACPAGSDQGEPGCPG